MTPRISDLFAKKEELFQHICKIDELIKLEVESVELPTPPAELVSTDKADLAAVSVGGATSISASNVQASDYSKLNWTKKLLHHLRLAGQRGMSTTELTKALKDYHQGEWKKPSVSLLLNALEKNGKVQVDRSAGRNRYYFPTTVQ